MQGDGSLTTPPKVSKNVAAASTLGKSVPFRMCQVKRKWMAQIAMAVIPVDAMMAAILYIVCSLHMQSTGHQAGSARERTAAIRRQRDGTGLEVIQADECETTTSGTLRTWRELLAALSTGS